MRRAGRSLLAVAALTAFVAAASTSSLAVEPHEILPDAKLEARARALSAELRCLVCQNQSIDDSNAPLAKDLRIIVRERLVAGDSDAQVRQFVVARYGEFVLLKPPFAWNTLLLWLTPALVLGATGWLLVARRRSSAAAAPLPLDAEEQRRLDELLHASAKDRSG